VLHVDGLNPASNLQLLHIRPIRVVVVVREMKAERRLSSLIERKSDYIRAVGVVARDQIRRESFFNYDFGCVWAGHIVLYVSTA